MFWVRAIPYQHTIQFECRHLVTYHFFSLRSGFFYGGPYFFQNDLGDFRKSGNIIFNAGWFFHIYSSVFFVSFVVIFYQFSISYKKLAFFITIILIFPNLPFNTNQNHDKKLLQTAFLFSFAKFLWLTKPSAGFTMDTKRHWWRRRYVQPIHEPK